MTSEEFRSVNVEDLKPGDVVLITPERRRRVRWVDVRTAENSVGVRITGNPFVIIGFHTRPYVGFGSVGKPVLVKFPREIDDAS